jgi:hypothetical protein
LNGTWTAVSPPYVSSPEWELWGVYFTSSSEGWAVGVDAEGSVQGLLLHYLNGTWTAVSPPYVSSSSWSLQGVHFTSSNEGWAVGVDAEGSGQGVLLHYFNGTWTAVSPPYLNSSGWSLQSVHFTSPTEGWAVGGDPDLSSVGALINYNTTAAKYSWNTTMSTKASISGIGSTSGVSYGNLTLYDDGTFNLYDATGDYTYTGTYVYTTGKQKDTVRFTLDQNGVNELKTMLTVLAEDYAAGEGVEVSNINFQFNPPTNLKITISKKTNLPSSLKVSIRGKVSAILEGKYKNKSFSYSCIIAFQ